MSEMDWGELGALSLMVRVAWRVPGAVGVKLRITLQEVFGA